MPLAPTPGSPATSSFNAFAAQYGSGTTGMPSAGAAGGYLPGSSVQQTPLIYWGLSHHPSAGMDYMDQPYKTYHSNSVILTADQALQKFEQMSVTKQRDMLRLLAIAGFTDGGTIPLDKVDDYVKAASLDDAISAYSNLLETSAGYYMNSGMQVTPTDVLKSRIGYRMKVSGVKWNGDLGTFSDGVKDALKGSDLLGTDTGAKPGTYTTTTKSTDFLNPADAKSLVRQTLQNELGRDPTQGEYEDFLAAIHAAERQDPSTQTTTSKYVLDNNGNLRLADQNTVTHQGVGVSGLEQLAQERAQRQPGWAEWQAMGTYAPALFQALGASVPGV